MTDWLLDAAHLVAEIATNGDDNGSLANATADELRDALRVAADRINVLEADSPNGIWLTGTRRLVAEVWWLVQEHVIDARSRAADAALDMRDMIDPDWWPDRNPVPAPGSSAATPTHHHTH